LINVRFKFSGRRSKVTQKNNLFHGDYRGTYKEHIYDMIEHRVKKVIEPYRKQRRRVLEKQKGLYADLVSLIMMF
jgi:hypothetical protein